MPREVFYALSKARNDLSGVIRRVRQGSEEAIVTVDGQPVAKIIAFSESSPGNTKAPGGMTKEQIRKALDSTQNNPEMLRNILELFI